MTNHVILLIGKEIQLSADIEAEGWQTGLDWCLEIDPLPISFHSLSLSRLLPRLALQPIGS